MGVAVNRADAVFRALKIGPGKLCGEDGLFGPQALVVGAGVAAAGRLRMPMRLLLRLLKRLKGHTWTPPLTQAEQ